VRSSFSWLDTSESDRRRMSDVVAAFREKSTRDEMGVGTIRDGLSDLMFPGTSTIQTRTRYFLFLPWIYRKLEQQKVSSSEIGEKARRMEITLLKALQESDDQEGLIGRDAGGDVQRLPGSIYWNGLRKWGLLRFDGSQSQYHRSLDAWYRRQAQSRAPDDGEPGVESVGLNWHAGIPSEPKGFPYEVSFRMREEDSEYVKARILMQAGDSVLAFLVRRGEALENTPALWESEVVADLPVALANQMHQAHHFSLVIQGATLLYNWMLADKLDRDAKRDEFQSRITEWTETMSEAKAWDWQPHDLWQLLDASGARVPPKTKTFVEQWKSGIQSNSSPLWQEDRLKQLILHRESSLKRSQARLVNPRALELWNGDAGTGLLTYRWANVLRHLRDLTSGEVDA
jgi:hypothetical protein